MVPIALDQTGTEIHTADGVFLKQYVFPYVGMIVPQHAHRYDHTTMIVQGAVRVHCADRDPQEVHAPTGLLIRAGVKHTFETLEPQTVIWCIHNEMHPDVAAVVEENSLEFG